MDQGLHGTVSDRCRKSRNSRFLRRPVSRHSSTICLTCWRSSATSSTQNDSSCAAISTVRVLILRRCMAICRRCSTLTGCSSSSTHQHVARRVSRVCSTLSSAVRHRNGSSKLPHDVSDHELLTWTLVTSNRPRRQVQSYRFCNFKKIDLERTWNGSKTTFAALNCSSHPPAPQKNLPTSYM